MKAGLAPGKTEPAKDTKKKSLSPQKEHKKFHEHQVRTECELCSKYAPDVEYYHHTNKFVSVKWLCMNCADENKISDDVRQTAQSTDVRSGRFSRRYGRTKKV